jgi:nucleoside diphosphate kinase
MARLIMRTGLDLVAARMFAPSAELVQEYAAKVVSSNNPQDARVQHLVRDYIQTNFSPDPRTGRRRRVMVLLFRGEDAASKVRSVVGNFTLNRRSGETIRDTYGDLIIDEAGTVKYFEPAVMAAPSAEEMSEKLRIWAKYSDTDGGIVENTIIYNTDAEKNERTLVLLKPDNFRFPTGRPGNMMDLFSRTGLYIVGIKVHQMSVAQACQFYGQVRDVLKVKLKDPTAARASQVLEKELGFKIPAETEKQLGDLLGPLMGDHQFDIIVRFMTGRTPGECNEQQRTGPGTEKCIALVYEGPNAVSRIRDVLGPTDPSKAPPGSIRREFGQTITVNAAHASDSAENAQREIGIVQPAENNFRTIVEEFLGKI